MTVKLSTGIRDALVETRAAVAALILGSEDTISFVDGDAGEDTITIVTSDWRTEGFEEGMVLYVEGATTGGNDSGVTGKQITQFSGSDKTLHIATGSVAAAEALPSAGLIAAARGGSIADLLELGFIKIFSGSQPASPNDAETGTELVKITKNSGTHATGTGENGLQFEAEAAAGVLAKKAAEVWSGQAGNTGTGGWFRFYAKEGVAGASTTAIRFDGSVGTSGADLQMASTSITSGATVTIDNFTITMPIS